VQGEAVEQAPQECTSAGALMLVSGVLNFITAGMLFISFVWVCVGVLWLIPMIVGASEAFVGFQLLQGTRQPSAKTASIFGVIAGALNCNPIPVVCEVIALTMLSKPEVAGYLESR
jgi:hypothetical protein